MPPATSDPPISSAVLREMRVGDMDIPLRRARAKPQAESIAGYGAQQVKSCPPLDSRSWGVQNRLAGCRNFTSGQFCRGCAGTAWNSKKATRSASIWAPRSRRSPIWTRTATRSRSLNEDDEVETPSLILLAESGHVVVGPSRTRAAMEDPQNVVERIKRHMGHVGVQADVRRPRDHAGVPLRADPQEAQAGRREADRQDRQRRDHGAVLLQRRPPQGHAGRRADRRAERGRHHQRADGRHADLRLGPQGAGRRGGEATPSPSWRWSTTWAAARST